MGACTQPTDRGSVSRYRCARPLLAAASCSLLAPAQHTSPEQGMTVSQQSWPDRRRGVDAARAMAQHSSSSLLFLIIRASMRLHKPPSTCALGVWGVACACVCEGVYARACGGRASERYGVKRVWGKQTVSSPGILGVCVCVCLRVCDRMYACACMPVCVRCMPVCVLIHL
jgi:hypothetical protein